MEKEQYIVALEIGSSKILGAVATKNPQGGVALIALEEEKVVDCVRYGVIQNIEETNTRIIRIIRKLENRASVAPNKIKGVFVGIEGRSLRNIETEVEHTFQEETGITQSIIDSIKKESKSVPIAGFDILDVMPRKFIIDKAEAKSPVGMFGSHISAKLNLIVAKPTLKNNLKRVIEERLQLNVKGYLVAPICTAEEILSYDERQLGCMLVDFGAETTTISIYKNDVLVYLSTMPFGSRNITRDITALNLLEDKAEDLKKTIGNALSNDSSASQLKIEGINAGDVSNFIIARAGEIAANIIAQLEYAEVSTADLPEGIILIGGGAKLNGFAELMEQQTKLKVRKGSVSHSINILEHRVAGPEYAQIVALLAKGAAKLQEDDNCCEAPIILAPQEPQPVVEPVKKEEEDKGPSKLQKLLERVKTTATSIFNETDDEDE